MRKLERGQKVRINKTTFCPYRGRIGAIIAILGNDRYQVQIETKAKNPTFRRPTFWLRLEDFKSI